MTQAEDGAFVLSSLYDWYRGDCGKSDAGFIDHLAQFARAGLSAKLSVVTVFEVDQYRYDWALNEVQR